ncbi:MerR family DNA-binding transcriptional regulator, partial [Pseudomonas aeruginosa]
MKIGELAKLTGLATSRIRFYEASGLIRSQRKANGYRDYAADTVWILELVTGGPGGGVDREGLKNQRGGSGRARGQRAGGAEVGRVR